MLAEGGLSPSQPLSLDTSQTVDPFILDVITYYVRMGAQPIYFQIYMVKVSFLPGTPRGPRQPAGPHPAHPGSSWGVASPAASASSFLPYEPLFFMLPPVLKLILSPSWF